MRVTLVAERGAARALVRAKQTGAALVVPAGTSAALAAGQPSQLILYTDPVKVIELDVIRDLVQEIRHEVEVAARDEAVAELEATRDGALEARAALDRAAADLRRELDDATTRLAAARSDASRARREGERALSASLTRLRAEQKAARQRRARFASASAAELPRRPGRARRAFTAWAEAVRARAGRFVDRIPPPPDPLVVPPALAELARAKPSALAARLVPPVSLPPLPDRRAASRCRRRPPVSTCRSCPEPPRRACPGCLPSRRRASPVRRARSTPSTRTCRGSASPFSSSACCSASRWLLLDERDWGTFARLRATPTPLAVVLGAKLTARFVVGIVQMALLFAVGRLFFGVSARPRALGARAADRRHRSGRRRLWPRGRGARAEPRGRAAARIDRHPHHGGRGRLLVADRSRAALDAVRGACLSDLLGDGRLQRPDDPPPDGERGDHRDARAPHLCRRLSGHRPHALPPIELTT